MEKDLFDAKILTIGFARRLVPYKRADLIFRDLDRLRSFGGGKLQLVFAGNTYKNDPFSNGVVKAITEYANQLRGQIKIALITRYNLGVAKRLVSGCDLWLNNPMPGTEASGTSGMKAALNGVPNLSTMDGWWAEAYRSDVRSGWGFGEFVDGPDRGLSDFNQLAGNLENITDCYYNRQGEWHEKMTHSIALLSFFNTYRMTKEYNKKMWN
jgi:glycogen phosphorylase